MQPTSHVVINGGGLAGLAHAITFARRGWRVTVAERAASPRRDGFMIGFYGRGFDALSTLDLEAALRAVGRDYAGAQYVDGRDRTTARVSLDGFRRGTRGRFVSVLRPELEDVLRRALPAAVDVRFGTHVVGLTPGWLADARSGARPAEVTLSDGSTIRCDLVLGADGLHSAVRGMLGSPESTALRLLQHHTAAWTLHDPAMAAELGDTVRVSDVTGGQVGLLALDIGMPDRRPAADRGMVSGYAVLPGGRELPDDPAARIRTELTRHGSLARSIADRLPDEPYYDLVAQTVLPSWRVGRVLLVGDAAHAVSPVAGQGASLAIAGAAALADALDESPDLATGLTRYEQRWRRVVTPIQAAARRAAPAYIAHTRAGLRLRRLALRAGNLPILEPLLTRRAVGDELA